MKTCCIDNCDKPLIAKGMCSMHYTRVRNHGSVDKNPAPSPKRSELTGQRFGKLLVQEMIYATWQNSKARCLCDCGSIKIALAYNLKSGNTASCGCTIAGTAGPPGEQADWRQKRADRTRQMGLAHKTHGFANTPTYTSWSDAKKRCYSPQNKRYADYGARGIGMCQQWRESFAAFLADMGERPVGMTLDRKEVDGNYEPGNCRWATKVEQSQNTRANVANWDKVRAIRSEYANGATAQSLAEKFCMSDSNVYMIVQHKTWVEAA